MSLLVRQFPTPNIGYGFYSSRLSQGTAHTLISLRPCLKARPLRAIGTDANTVDTAEQLRLELERLKEEAKDARERADRSRARFMRLTEAVEQLRLQAAREVRSGNEICARQILQEKQVVMHALEVTKSRAGLLEALATRLGQAIARKESQLIAALSSVNMQIDMGDETNRSSVRVAYPRDLPVAENESSHSVPDAASGPLCTEENGANNTLDLRFTAESGLHSRSPFSDNQQLSKIGKQNLFTDYIVNINDQFLHIEKELQTFLDVAIILADDRKANVDEKVVLIEELLNGIHGLRERISNFLGEKGL